MEESERQLLVVQMETRSVEMWTRDGVLLRGDVFLRVPHVSTERGDRLRDMLSERAFLPLKTAEKLLFVNTDNIAWVRMDMLAGVDELDAEVEDDINSCTAVVIIDLGDGTKVEGMVRYSRPHTALRLGDYLDQLPPFVALRGDDWLYLVNAAAMATVTPLEEKR